MFARKLMIVVFVVVLIGGACSQRTNPFGPFETFSNIRNDLFSEFDEIKDENEIQATYDFVVIGAGSAGSVVTNRLTEEPWDVLLIEAGREEMFLTDMPLLAPALYRTDYNWGYLTEPSSKTSSGNGYCLAMVGGRCRWPQGKGLGGTSLINYMLYTRGAKSDYDEWERMGNTGWSYEDVLPYFKKSEKMHIVGLNQDYHGYDGYLAVDHSPYVSKLGRVFLDSAQEMGYPVNDYNAERLLGFSLVQANLKGGRRCSASKAFLQSVKNRKNLHVSKLSRVTRIVIDPVTKTAQGVEFVKNRKRYLVKASKEVILSAGALNSPHLLMLSGIGPGDHLKTFGIPVIEDLPVGYNLQDHVSMNGLAFLVNDTVTLDELRTAFNPINSLDYFLRGTGPYTVPAGAEGIAFLNTQRPSNSKTRNTSKINRERGGKRLNSGDYQNLIDQNDTPDSLNEVDDYADIEVVMGLSSFTGDHAGILRGILNVREDFVREMYSEYMGRDAFSMVPIVMHPKSRGRVTLKSSDPFQWPLLYPNYFGDPEDLKTLVRGIKKVVELADTRAFQRYNAKLVPVPFPGCRHLPFKSDPYWECGARLLGTTLAHFAGTCKMAPRNDSGVVDARLRVHGIRRLRVVDTSIIPKLISGHTNGPAYMIGEKASDMIKEDWKRS